VHAGVQPSAWFDAIEKKLSTLQHVLKLLISGEADADRMDYLLRDSYFCGAAYGSFDLDWMISSLSAQERDGRFVLTLAENGVRAFEAFLLARYHMFDQVYFHKTKAGFIHYLEQAIKTREIPLTIPTDPYEYADLRDGRVVEMLFDASKNPQNYWSRHFVHRIPAKRIARFHEEQAQDRLSMGELLNACAQANIVPFIHRVGKELTSITDDESSTLFVEKRTWKGSELVPVFAYSDLLRKYNESLSIADVFVRREDAATFAALVKTV
jgi:HD superfamily phosphohydrolase